MVNKQYRRGRRFEYEMKKWFEERGWMAFRTAGSHGLADVIAVKDYQTLLVQCKYGQMPTKQERMEMAEVENKTSSTVRVVLAFREPYKKLKFMDIDRQNNFIEVDFDTEYEVWSDERGG